MNLKKIAPILIAVVIFVVALAAIRPEATIPVVVAARDLPLGHPLSPADLEIRSLPKALVPQGAVTDPTALAGQTLAIPRSAGDVILPTHLGGESLKLAPDERAIAIQVSDSAGLAGLLKPGDRVGVTAVIFGSGPGANQGAYSKTITGNLRVLYVSPEFAAVEADTAQSSDEEGRYSPPASSSGRKLSGAVVLAVPVHAVALSYDFSAVGVAIETKQINVVDLLPALDHATNVELSLFLEPDAPQAFTTSGVYLPDLVITPGPSPTPTATLLPGAFPPAAVTPVPPVLP